MPKYYGCPCEGCGEPLTLKDDIVVCPDCGGPLSPYLLRKAGPLHPQPRPCGRVRVAFPVSGCRTAHLPQLRERTLRSERSAAAAALPAPVRRKRMSSTMTAKPHRTSSTAALTTSAFTASTSSRPWTRCTATCRPLSGRIDADRRHPQQRLDDLHRHGAPAYLNDYSGCMLQHTKISLSFSALLFGPFYFFYRKAWKPAFAFSGRKNCCCSCHAAADDAVTGSSLSLGLSDSTYVVLGRVVSLASFCAHAGARHVCQVVLTARARRCTSGASARSSRTMPSAAWCFRHRAV